jgi:hypothetical protein
MNRVHRALGFSLVPTIIVICACMSSCTSPRSLEALAGAKDDPWTLWVALLKGFSGEVIYVGSSDTHAYFRIGRFFGDYYKTPACSALLPQIFAVGRGTPYVVRLHVENGYIAGGSTCPASVSYPLGRLDRG